MPTKAHRLAAGHPIMPRKTTDASSDKAAIKEEHHESTPMDTNYQGLSGTHAMRALKILANRDEMYS